MGHEWGMDGAKTSAMGHFWGIVAHMIFTEFHMRLAYNCLIKLNKTHALGRCLVIFKIPASRS